MRFDCKKCGKSLLEAQTSARIVIDASVSLNPDYLDGEEELMIEVSYKGGNEYNVEHVFCPSCGTANEVPDDVTYQVVI